jgi:hypothetical protein
LKQLLSEPLAGSYVEARCWALDADEARAEKVRAAFTRDAIRDFYDLERLEESGADLISQPFLQLVDEKLEELGSPSLAKHTTVFGLIPKRLKKLRRQVDVDLPSVLRQGAPRFDLDRMVGRFAKLWNLPSPPSSC